MLRAERADTCGWEFAIRGMRNPMNSWDKNDSKWVTNNIGVTEYILGPNDLELAQKLILAGSDHAKFMRMIHIQADIIAPMYWWKEFDTYKVATVRNSCSTMHKLMDRKLDESDFSFEYCYTDRDAKEEVGYLVDILNNMRDDWIAEPDNGKKKQIWYRIIQMLPSSYNQKSTIDLSYQTARAVYFARRNHKLQEWHQFIDMLSGLPYADELIFLEN
jgi:hypothetical protein